MKRKTKRQLEKDVEISEERSRSWPWTERGVGTVGNGPYLTSG